MEALDLDRHGPIARTTLTIGRGAPDTYLGNDDVRASIPGEIVPHREFYDYTAKYLEEGTRLVIPAPLTKKQVVTLARHFHVAPAAFLPA